MKLQVLCSLLALVLGLPLLTLLDGGGFVATFFVSALIGLGVQRIGWLLGDLLDNYLKELSRR